MKKLHQPYFVAYVVAGILLGPYCFRIFNKPDTIAAINERGLLMQTVPVPFYNLDNRKHNH